ncbi:MAG: peptidase E [Candidatus Nanohaloarchaea archaeon]|nr:peptidase E [Candidatus Nanohaloarchaea archaeon]
MGDIVAIGGGELAEHETLPIDREIVSLTGVDDPAALFIPTASDDGAGYIETFHQVYGRELGCDTDVLRLVEHEPSTEEVRETIAAADLVYVGGGNTRKMMRLWNEHGADDLLREAYRDGTVLSGLSAGAICWFEAGHSDSESYETDGEWEYIRVDGLGLVEDVLFCPHYHAEEREEPFRTFMKQYPGKTGLAVDDGAAVHVRGDRFRILAAGNDPAVYRVTAEKNGVQEERLEADGFRELSSLQSGSGRS